MWSFLLPAREKKKKNMPNKSLNNNRSTTQEQTGKRNLSEVSPGTATTYQEKLKMPKKNQSTSRPQSEILITTRSRSPSVQRKIPDYWLSTQNKFDVLDDETNTTKETEKKEIIKPKNEKPPPIFVYGVENIQKLAGAVESTVGKRFLLKSLMDKKIKILLANKEDYKKITEMLIEKNTQFHSFQLKDEKSFRVVLKGVHPKTDTDELIKAIKDEGHDVLNIAPIRSKQTGYDLPMFFINLKAKTNNKEIMSITRLLYMVVKFEKPHLTKRNDIPQCLRCQKFGHTKKYCHLSPRCVKCTNDHLTSECPRNIKDNNVKCVNCHGDHPANYKGCTVYQALRQKLYPELKKKQEKARTDEYIDPNIPFAEKLSGKPARAVQSLTSTSNDIAELKSMMKDLMTQMSTMLNLLTAVVTKLNN